MCICADMCGMHTVSCTCACMTSLLVQSRDSRQLSLGHFLLDLSCYSWQTPQNFKPTPVFQMWSHSCILEISQTSTCSSTPVPPSAGRIPPAVCSGSTVAPDTHNWLIMSVIYCTSLYLWGVRLTNALLHSRKIASAWTCSGLTVFSPNCVTG